MMTALVDIRWRLPGVNDASRISGPRRTCVSRHRSGAVEFRVDVYADILGNRLRALKAFDTADDTTELALRSESVSR